MSSPHIKVGFYGHLLFVFQYYRNKRGYVVKIASLRAWVNKFSRQGWASAAGLQATGSCWSIERIFEVRIFTSIFVNVVLAVKMICDWNESYYRVVVWMDQIRRSSSRKSKNAAREIERGRNCNSGPNFWLNTSIYKRFTLNDAENSSP